MNKLAKTLTMVGLTVFPIVALAQLTRTETLITRVGTLARQLVLVVAGIALLFFFWGLAQFIFKVRGDEKAVDQGKALMKWGLIAFFVMLSVWGIVRFFQGELLPGVDFSPPPGLFGP
ncbi:MAG: hypothetical protein AAB695_00645 [Patescibacteria group bacterium]